MIMEIINHLKSLNIKRSVLIFLFFSHLHLSSQDIKAGYMQVLWQSGYKYADTTYLLTDANTNVNRPYILINWGVKTDTSKLVQTISTNNGFLKKYYGTCTYPGPGNFMIRWQDSFRVANINNIFQSDNENIKLSTFLYITPFSTQANTAPILQNKNMTLLIKNDSVIFKPQFYDLDNDSLTFELTQCFASSYYTAIGSSIDVLGNVSFHKDSLGIYAFSLIVKEWRNDGAGTDVNIQSSQLDFTMNITTDVSLNYINEFHNIKISPNPTTSILNIDDKNNQLQNSTIQIKNYLGQLVFCSPFANQINLQSLSAGMYFLTIQDKENNKTVKILKE